MGTSVRNRLLAIIATIAMSIWAIYPPAEKIKLGLDLEGGVQLVLRVQTDGAVRLETQTALERLRERLGTANISVTGIEAISPTVFKVEGVSKDEEFRRASADLEGAFDRASNGSVQTFRLRPGVEHQLREDTVQQALETINRRVNELGVVEPVVARYGNDDRILVQLPGVTDVERAKQIIKSTAQVRLTLVDRGPFPSQESALQAYGQPLPSDLEVLPGQSHDPAAPDAVYYVVRKLPALTGSDLRNARQSLDEMNQPAVAFTIDRDATTRFAELTAQNVNRALATVLDNRVASVATILSRIDGQGQITGLSRDEMIAQVITLKSGALPADLDYVEESTVSASLGAASIRAGVVASAGGLVFVLLFMLAYYRRAGWNALVSIAMNLLILIAMVAYVPVTLTLPGIAGLILTIGMGVDSNVLIFERIKEELAAARGARAAVDAGFKRVWLTIVDTHVTSLIAAAFLYQFGTSAIRGFATMLTIGLVANVFTAVFVSRTVFELTLRGRRTGRRRSATQTLSIASNWRFFRLPDVDVSRWQKPALALSIVVIAAGLAVMASRGLSRGIDFSGGSQFVVEFARQDVTADDVRGAVSALPGDEVVQRYGPVEDRRFLVRVPVLPPADGGDSLEAGARQVMQALQVSPLSDFRIVSRDLISAAVGEEMQRRGVYATVASLGAIAAYIGIRFRFFFAMGAIAATVHDVLVTLACLSFAGYDLSLNVTAALLTIIGYSVNDTIVVFDRVRENLKAMRTAPLAAVVNLSVNQTLPRTVITAGLTLLAVLSLYLFGGETLRGFAFTVLVGIASGTWSTVFIASAIGTLSRRQIRRRVGSAFSDAA